MEGPYGLGPKQAPAVLLPTPGVRPPLYRGLGDAVISPDGWREPRPVTNAQLAAMNALTIKANGGGWAAAPQDLSITNFSLDFGIPVLLQTQTVGAAVSSVDFTGLTSYPLYMFDVENLVPQTSAADFYIRTGAGSFDAGNNYRYAWTFENTGPANGGVAANPAAQWVPLTSIATSAGVGVSGTFWFYPSSGQTYIRGLVSGWQGSDYVQTSFMGVYITASPDRLRFLFNGQNVNAGTIKVYGFP